MRPLIVRAAPVALAVHLVSLDGALNTAAAQPGPDQRSTVQDSGPKQESPNAQQRVPHIDEHSSPKGSDNKSLSEKLKDGEGVLAPPAAGDPDIRKPAPVMPGNTMPVIIPPGEPGGDQSVQPK